MRIAFKEYHNENLSVISRNEIVDENPDEKTEHLGGVAKSMWLIFRKSFCSQ
uniref:Uncharacterized protein n=1 Tax=Octopus bimaculoides TaxID=37653 RepID=A0A0L8HR23_OCTBM